MNAEYSVPTGPACISSISKIINCSANAPIISLIKKGDFQGRWKKGLQTLNQDAIAKIVVEIPGIFLHKDNQAEWTIQ